MSTKFIPWGKLKSVTDESKTPPASDPQSAPDHQAGADQQSEAVVPVSGPPLTESAAVPQSPADEQSASASQSAPDQQSAPDYKSVAPTIEIAPKGGWMAVPHAIADNLLPSLHPYDQLVFLRIYRLTFGHGREECIVSHGALGKACNISWRTALRSLERLTALGLVERYGADLANPDQLKRGNRYRLGSRVVPHLPTVRQSAADRRSGGDPQSATDYGSGADRQSGMKDSGKKRSERAAPVAVAPAPEFSVYDVRRIAARFRELHHGEADYTRDRLRADVRTALIGEGREPDERLIDEAIGA
jgi:hypothetical protein